MRQDNDEKELIFFPAAIQERAELITGAFFLVVEALERIIKYLAETDCPRSTLNKRKRLRGASPYQKIVPGYSKRSKMELLLLWRRFAWLADNFLKLRTNNLLPEIAISLTKLSAEMSEGLSGKPESEYSPIVPFVAAPLLTNRFARALNGIPQSTSKPIRKTACEAAPIE